MRAPHALLFLMLGFTVLLPLGTVPSGAASSPAGPPPSAAVLAPEDFEYSEIMYPNSLRTAVFGMNAEGAMVGRYSKDASGATWRGFMLQDGVFTDIFVEGSKNTTGYGINARGDVVGVFVDQQSKTRAFVWADGGFTEITIEGQSNVYAYDINDSGVVVGGYGNVTTRQPWVNFVWRDGEHAALELPPVNWAEALGINDRGEIAGHFVKKGDNTNHMIGFLLSKGTFTEVDYPEPNAMACFQGIADTGRAVGHVQLGTIVYGTIWAQGRFTATLRVPGVNTYPHDMTPSGIVAGYYQDSGGRPHGFVARQIR